MDEADNDLKLTEAMLEISRTIARQRSRTPLRSCQEPCVLRGEIEVMEGLAPELTPWATGTATIRAGRCCCTGRLV